jgi:magnesium transporter
MIDEVQHLQKPVVDIVRKDFSVLSHRLTIAEALEKIREHGVGEKIIYFYVVDESHCLVGVLPTRRLLTASPDRQISDLMISRVVAIPSTATVLEACELFLLHKFLAFPVVDADRRIVGVVDVSQFTQEVLDLAEYEQMDEVFEAIGFRISQVQGASPLRMFRFRFPWLLATISSGFLCALLSSGFEVALSKSILLAFFLALVLGLGESVSIQSMTVTIQALRGIQPSWKWYFKTLRRELGAGLLLGLVSGFTVGGMVWLWRGDGLVSLVIGGSIFLSICSASLLGLSIPGLLHAMRLDPKIAAGPITLALADLCTILGYLGLATICL